MVFWYIFLPIFRVCLHIFDFSQKIFGGMKKKHYFCKKYLYCLANRNATWATQNLNKNCAKCDFMTQ